MILRLGISPECILAEPIPAFLPGESHGERSLAGYNPQGCKESHVTEAIEHKHGLWSSGSAAVISVGLVALQLVASSWTRDRTCVSCTGGQILND